MSDNLNDEESGVVLIGVSKTYVNTPKAALHDVSLAIKSGEFLCIVGASGCGKSTLLKIITGLERADKGELHAPAHVSMVFQSGALLPWLTVEENVKFGLPSQEKNKKDAGQPEKKYLDMVELSDFAQKYPRELSGGQRQRVGLARALAAEPQALLLDEPFSALDPKTTDDLHKDLLKIWKETGVTVIMVSHLIEEAVSLADRVVLMKDGRIEEIFPIALPYPRRESGIAFHELVQKIRAKFFQ
ncbi:MAG TPA: ABC transporter ATP-binding protein [Candidatus Paceibacterota bacterium]